MISKNQIKLINSLNLPKFRKENGLFVAEGVKLVDEILNSNFVISCIFGTLDWIKNNEQKIQNREVEEISEIELNKISNLSTPNQVLALVEIPKYNGLKNPYNELILGLDDIRDPGNMGTIIRIADWFGISTIICSENTVDCFNPKVIQSTMGSICRVKVIYSNLGEFINKKPKDHPVYGTLLEGENIYITQLQSKGLIVIGNESNGISIEIKKQLTHSLHIPSFSEGNVGYAESLNASIATAIVCSEFKRRNI